MTALNVLVGSMKAFILTDASLYHPDGEIVMFGRKAAVARDARIAVATRGDHRLPAAIAQACDDLYEGIDELIDEAGESIRSLYETTIAEIGAVEGGPGAAAEMFFVGWSARESQPVAFWLAYDGETWGFEELGDGFLAPMPNATEFSRLRLQMAEPASDYEVDDFDPVKHGIPLLEAQRRMPPAKVPGAPQSFVIGGEVLLTTIGQAGIEQSVIHSWPDEVGKPIRPEPFAVPLVEGMSRQQRRAAARQAGKAAA